MKENISKRERFKKWWKVEGKIEAFGGLLVLITFICYWGNVYADFYLALFCSLWLFVKIYFKRDQWQILLLGAAFALYQAITIYSKHIGHR